MEKDLLRKRISGQVTAGDMDLESRLQMAVDVRAGRSQIAPEIRNDAEIEGVLVNALPGRRYSQPRQTPRVQQKPFERVGRKPLFFFDKRVVELAKSRKAVLESAGLDQQRSVTAPGPFALFVFAAIDAAHNEMRQILKTPLRAGLKKTDRFHVLVKKFDAQRRLFGGIEKIDDTAANRKLAGLPHQLRPPIAVFSKPGRKRISSQARAGRQSQSRFAEAKRRDQRSRGGHQHPALCVEPSRKRMAAPQKRIPVPQLLAVQGGLFEQTAFSDLQHFQIGIQSQRLLARRHKDKNLFTSAQGTRQPGAFQRNADRRAARPKSRIDVT